MGNFLTRVDIRNVRPGDLDGLNRQMHSRRFFMHVVGPDNTPYVLPPATYFSFHDLSAAQVRNLAGEAAKVVGKLYEVVTVEVVDGRIAWMLDRVLPELPSLGAHSSPAIPPQEPERDLLEKIQQTMEKVRPIAETTAKVSSDFGQMLIKGCTTLNAGALVAMPAFYKALAPSNAPTPRGIYLACIVFAIGLAAGAVAGWVAFLFTSQVTRMLIRSLQMPMLKAQQSMHPDTMDKAQLKRLSKAESGMRWGESIATLGLWAVSVASFVSVGCLIGGAYYGASATLSLTGH